MVDMAQHMDTATFEPQMIKWLDHATSRICRSPQPFQVHMHCYGGVDEDAAGSLGDETRLDKKGWWIDFVID